MARPGTTMLGEHWHVCSRSGMTFPESRMIQDTKGQWIAVKFADPEDTEEGMNDNSGD